MNKILGQRVGILLQSGGNVFGTLTDGDGDFIEISKDDNEKVIILQSSVVYISVLGGKNDS